MVLNYTSFCFHLYGTKLSASWGKDGPCIVTISSRERNNNIARIKVKTWPRISFLKWSRKFLGWEICKSSNICGTITKCLDWDVHSSSRYTPCSIDREIKAYLKTEMGCGFHSQVIAELGPRLKLPCWVGTLVLLRQDRKVQWKKFCRLTHERPQQWKYWQPLVYLNYTKPMEHAQKSPSFKNLLWVHKRSLYTSLNPSSPFELFDQATGK